MATTTISKKRKRDIANSDEVTLQVSNSSEIVGPVLASFPTVQPPKSTPFSLYLRNTQEESASSRNALLVGETDTIEFISTDNTSVDAAGCSYLVGIYNKRTKKATLRPAPFHLLARQVKALKNLQSIQVSSEERMKLRNALGETFGTKKAKAAIRAAERNRVDVDAMQSVASHLQARIEENTESLPTQEEAKATTDSSRLIPPYNENASHPEAVYKLHDIIPEAEFNALSISSMKNVASSRERIALLPYSRSTWVNQHLDLAFSSPKPNKKHVKVLIYISAMLAFKTASRVVSDKQTLQERLRGVPTIVLDGLLSRFTETTRDKNEPRITPQTETMLLTYMFALCLHVDDFATDTTLLAKDLSMATAKVNPLFKSLGCKIETLNHTELKRLGLPDTAAATKRAVLTIPLTFPANRIKRARR